MAYYEFGTFENTIDGKEFRVIATADCDGDDQAEHQSRRILENPADYDLTDMDAKPIKSLTIRRNGATW